ncbi:glycosyltransferase [Hymenobacter cheonanensis]|uniref:glycosyltransferase n=1 Tax=Hymenobacter sp. CA2-7 TaxID=3063993 RepID=UPI002713DA37|nr:glycosyltransferase [Hymenobacter sp. CA2-7]MDO7883754.1 glycosyltransferase [Hymenobacter sp. CA2-7]
MILLASVLKPIDDTRMLGKFAYTLAAAGARVAVAGRASAASPPATENISQHVIFQGQRLSLARLAAQGRYWRLLGQLRPALVVVHAPELLPLTLLWWALGRDRQFIYDIRENYALNVGTQHVYQGATKRLLAAGLRWVEGLAARQAAAVLLAEASYADELPFVQALPASRVLLLENKYQPAPGERLPRQVRPLPAADEPIKLLYSGTISELNGVREALALAHNLSSSWPGAAELTIIGFCQQPGLLGQLQVLIEQLAASSRLAVTLATGAEPVPHARIVAAMHQAHFGLLAYRPHPSTWRCRPTKLFEYLAHGLPVLTPDNPLWTSLMQAHGAGLVVDFAAAPAAAAAVVAALPTAHFYPAGVPTEAVLWASEGKKLRLLLESLGLGPTFAAPFA